MSNVGAGSRRPRARRSVAVAFAVLAYLWRARRFVLMVAASVLGGAILAVLAGCAGGGGVGAYVAIGLSMWFACLVGYIRPRSAILLVGVFTGTAAAVNYWGRAAVTNGAVDLMVFWGIWAFLMGFSLPALALGGLVGWSNRAFAERLRELRGESSVRRNHHDAEG